MNKKNILIVAAVAGTLAITLFLSGKFGLLSGFNISKNKHSKHDGHDHSEHDDDDHSGHDHSKHDDDDHSGHDHSEDDGDHSKQDDDEHAGHDYSKHDDKENKGVMDLSKKELEEFGVEISSAQGGTFETVLDLTGEIVMDPDRIAHITSRTAGVVKSVRKKLGATVKKNEVIAILESPQLAQAKIEYLSLNQQLELAKFDLNRSQVIHDNTARLLTILKDSLPLEKVQKKIKGYDLGNNSNRLLSSYIQVVFSKETYLREKKLFEDKISSRGDFLQAESEYKKAQANYLAVYNEIAFEIKRELLTLKRAVSVAQAALVTAKRRLRILGLSEKNLQQLTTYKDKALPKNELGIVQLKSPLPGIVIEKHITLGEFIKEDDTPFIIGNLKSVWAQLSVYQRDINSIRTGMEVDVFTKDNRSKIKGKIAYISPTITEKTRTATARIVIKNPKGIWKPGLFIKAKVTTEKSNIPILIPKTAVQMLENKPHVFIKSKKGFVFSAIEVGRSNKNFIEVISGLKAGQDYISKGGFVIKSEMEKGGFDHGHSH